MFEVSVVETVLVASNRWVLAAVKMLVAALCSILCVIFVGMAWRDAMSVVCQRAWELQQPACGFIAVARLIAARSSPHPTGAPVTGNVLISNPLALLCLCAGRRLLESLVWDGGEL
jgi:hypothetical protein